MRRLLFLECLLFAGALTACASTPLNVSASTQCNTSEILQLVADSTFAGLSSATIIMLRERSRELVPDVTEITSDPIASEQLAEMLTD
jgi:hypothetical protein